MKQPTTLKQFGKELRKLLNSAQVFSLLQDGDWGAGGCWTLAEALAEYLGSPAEIWVISEQRESQKGEIIDVPVSHVLVRYDDVFIDYNGAQTEEELFRNLKKEGYEYPQLADFTAELREYAESEWGVACDVLAKQELLKHLRQRFGVPR